MEKLEWFGCYRCVQPVEVPHLEAGGPTAQSRRTAGGALHECCASLECVFICSRPCLAPAMQSGDKVLYWEGADRLLFLWPGTEVSQAVSIGGRGEAGTVAGGVGEVG